MEFGIVFWFLFGLVGIIIANYKGQSGCLMFGLCFILGPIGIAIQLLMPTNIRRKQRRLINKGEMKRCDACSELVIITATKCRYCGETLIYKPKVKSRLNKRK